MFGSLIYKKTNIISSISVSILIILLINPYKILDIGMQLSYGGTIGIILLTKILEQKVKLPKRKNKIIDKFIATIKEMMIVSISANLIIFPIVAYHYNTVSLTFFISNILAGPILGLIIMLGFITIFISFISIQISKIPAIILSIFIKILILIANFSKSLPLSKIYVKTPNILTIIIYYAILAIVIYVIRCRRRAGLCPIRKGRRFQKNFLNKLKNKKTKKRIIVITLIIILIFQIIKIVPTNLKIYFIDVGQGDSTLIITPNHKNILIDGGGNETSKSYDIGKNTLLPYLLDRGITRLDYIFISHFDSDHVRTDYSQ
ncbi:MAG: MBL fold metallo-hydrolase [Clostridia bacterium]|nr:MBL fold metallo-hydrolase [Clostridia bacterium]